MGVLDGQNQLGDGGEELFLIDLSNRPRAAAAAMDVRGDRQDRN
jgi:hypothetical protein